MTEDHAMYLFVDMRGSASQKVLGALLNRFGKRDGAEVYLPHIQYSGVALFVQHRDSDGVDRRIRQFEVRVTPTLIADIAPDGSAWTPYIGLQEIRKKLDVE